ncbi:MAG: hypothetical protein WBG50_12750, partial [Desulfomonilaceae bacterium]
LGLAVSLGKATMNNSALRCAGRLEKIPMRGLRRADSLLCQPATGHVGIRAIKLQFAVRPL